MKQFFFFCLLLSSVIATAQTQQYYLRGSESTCPWGGNFTEQCELTDADGDGLFTLVLPLSQGIGDQEFKVYTPTGDMWMPGGANAWYKHTGGTMTFTYRPTTNVVSALDGSKSICAPGELNGWNNATPMTNEGGNVWCQTIATPDTFIWKPTECGTWNSWQQATGERSKDSPNWTSITTVANQKVCVLYDPATGLTMPTAAPVVGCTNPNASATATATSISVSWPAAAGATSYTVSYRPLGTTTFINVTVTGLSTTINNLVFNTNYQYRVKANCSSANGSLKTIKTLSTPTCSSTYFTSATATNNSVTLRWRQIFGEASQTLQYRKVGTTAWTTISVPVADSSRTITGLLAGSTYQYRLRAKCGATFLPYTAVRTITTLSPAIGNGDALMVDETELSISPNPTSATVMVRFNAERASIVLTDATGRKVMSVASLENGERLDVSQLPAGVYYLQATLPNSQTSTERIVKQ